MRWCSGSGRVLPRRAYRLCLGGASLPSAGCFRRLPHSVDSLGDRRLGGAGSLRSLGGRAAESGVDSSICGTSTRGPLGPGCCDHHFRLGTHARSASGAWRPSHSGFAGASCGCGVSSDTTALDVHRDSHVTERGRCTIVRRHGNHSRRHVGVHPVGSCPDCRWRICDNRTQAGSTV